MQKDQLIEMLRSQLGLGNLSSGETDQAKPESADSTERLVDVQRQASIAKEEAESHRQSLVCITYFSWSSL